MSAHCENANMRETHDGAGAFFGPTFFELDGQHPNYL